MENFTLSPDGSLLMTEGLGNPWLYNTANSSVESILTHDMGYVTGAAISPDNTLIIACVAPPAISYDPAVEGWSPNESSEAFTLLEKFAFSSGGQCEQTYITEETVGFFSYDGLYSRSRQGGEFSLVFPIPSNDYYRTLEYETIVIGTPGSGFYLVNPDHPTDSPFITLAQGAGVTALDKSAQQIARLDATRSEVIQVFAIHENEAVLSLVLESATPVTALSFSPDGRWLVSGQQNGEVLLWNLETGQAAARLSGKFGTIRTLIFSPDGDRLYGAGQDNVITIWALGLVVGPQ
jgi:WD40 repeat protein